MSEPENNEPFLSRWSRRKRGVAGEAEQNTVVPAADGAVAGDTPVGDVQTIAEGEQPLDLTTLPDVDHLTADSNIVAFLDKRVPAALRNAALGRMWTLDPTIRDFIEVAENQWNWNIPGGAPFYEEMLPGTGAGTLMSDATSAIARTVGEVVSAKPAAEMGHAEMENQQSHNGDVSCTDTVALHQNQPAELLTAPVAPPSELSDAVQASPVAVADTASQQSPAGALPFRPRHGGARPN